MSPTSMWSLSVSIGNPCPVLLSVRGQIVSRRPHVSRDIAVDVARSLVPERNRIPVRADGSIDRFPDLQLLARAAMAPQDVLESTEVPHREERLTIIVRIMYRWA